MKSDMRHILIDRPRSGNHFSKQPKSSRRKLYGRYQELDDHPRYESVTKPWIVAEQDKQFSDLLGPLERFLRTKIGQPWNSVYSEIREHVSPNSKMQLHLLDHVYDFVKTKVHIINNVPYDESFRPITTYKSLKLYVDTDGILKQAPVFSKKNNYKKERLWANKEKLQQYHKIKNIWYLIQLKEFKIKVISERYIQLEVGYDYVLKRIVYSLDYHELVELYGSYYYCVFKKQLNKREIRKAKLI